MQDKKHLPTIKTNFLLKGIEYLIQALGWGMVAILVFSLFSASEELKAKIPALLAYTLTPGLAVLWVIYLAKNWGKFE